MTTREFLKNLGDDKGPDFFGVSQATFKRWVKSGNVPLKAADKVLAAMQAMSQSEPAPATTPQPEQPAIDPYTKLPIQMDRRLPDIQVQAGGHLPDVIEISPTEQSFGMNLTRPGRLASARPAPPMKIKEEGGQKIAYVDNAPRTPTTLPPSIPTGTGWADKNESAPAKS